MLTKLMAFLKCQIALITALLSDILDATKANHTNLVKVNEICAKTADGLQTLSIFAIWDQNEDKIIGTVAVNGKGEEIAPADYSELSDCECIEAIDCCPE